MALARAITVAGLLLCLAGAWVLGDGAWGALGSLLLAATGVSLVALALPVVLIGCRTRRLSRGEVLLRCEHPLPEEAARELFRLVDLVRGRLAATLGGLDEGRCEVWICAGEGAAEAVSRARAVGVGRLGAAICPIPEACLARPHELPFRLSEPLARNAAQGLRGRLRGCLLEGMVEWLAVVGAMPSGVRRRVALHAEAARLSLSGPAAERWCDAASRRELPAEERRALSRSFTGFLVQRYGIGAYLRFLAEADRNPPHIALLLAYRRTPRELELRWRAFLEAGSGRVARP